MQVDHPTTIADLDDELDDPYVHSVSSEEFIQTVERASQEENEEALAPQED